MTARNLDGVTMSVRSADDRGVVDADTRLVFRQRGARVLGRYRGGRILRGVLAGALEGPVLTFRYLQVEASREIHGGRSICEVARTEDGRLRVVEHFRWTTRDGSGTNVFDEMPEGSDDDRPGRS
ncbi:MAG TPA: hypothetical protein VIA45_00635 [Thermoanaerobaculia bacterium]|jgi:hypothetical protein